MSVPLILRAEPAGRDQYGFRRFNIIITSPDIPDAAARVQGVCEQDLLTGAQYQTTLCSTIEPAKKLHLGPTLKQVRDSVTKQERATAEALGGHRQSGSGARRGYKGDGRVEGKFRIENKMTRAESMRVHLSDLRKIRSECSNQEVPVFEFDFRDRHTLQAKEKWALVPWKVWEERANAAGNDR